MAANRARGHRAGLTRQAVLEAAVRLADGEGLKALSMRRLGAELGVEAMTLYHYVPNKDALLDGIVERVVAEAVPPEFGAASWRESLRAYAESLVAVLSAHPNVMPLLMARPAMTPRNLRTMEDMVAALCGAGFAPVRALDVVHALTGFAVGHVATQAGGEGVAELLAVDADAYPLLARAAREAGGSRGEADAARFTFALDALLAGFEGELTQK
ncbi:TetR/AcrR family transcriptional regulator C-terminal domain-containing protein [Streptomyces sp. NPDC048172]|uniref:TetR/AcrR family transcriptional regulator C-terminal domain-containing protein n=1 Tax=Streptomyces sp. NPDC048172 TaxID=3365505 RepID=UPI00371589EF